MKLIVVFSQAVGTAALAVCGASVLAITSARAQGVSFVEDVKPIIDRKSVACHACFDAPAQFPHLRMEQPELTRGLARPRVLLGHQAADFFFTGTSPQRRISHEVEQHPTWTLTGLTVQHR